MTAKTVPLSIISTTGESSNSNQFVQIGIGSKILDQQPKEWAYWFLVLDRSTLDVVFNEVSSSANSVPDGLSKYDTADYILAFATAAVGLNNQPQGDLFVFLDRNGAGRELRRIDQIATQFNCGYLGTFGYALVGVLGDQNMPGFETSQISQPFTGPILTVQLQPMDIDGKTTYTPVQISNA